MRLMRGVVLVALAALTGCKSEDGGGAGPVDAFYGTPPPRMVSDFTPPDGAVYNPPPLPPPRDAPPPRDTLPPDAATAADAADAAAGDVPPGGALGCDLIRQDCPAEQHGCYPYPDGTSRCVVGTLRLPEGSPCSGPEDCARGYSCVEGLCRQLCDSDRPFCLGRAICKVIAAVKPVGYCAP